MAQIVYSRRATEDLDRLADFVAELAPTAGEKVKTEILQAVSVLATSPHVGRRVSPELRELVIARRRSGYVALYAYFEVEDAVVIVAIRHQRGSGYSELN